MTKRKRQVVRVHLIGLVGLESERTGTAIQRCRRATAAVGARRLEIVAAVAGQGRGATPVRIEAVATGRNVARLLRRIAAIAEVVVGRAIGGRPVVAVDVGAVAAEMAAHRPGLGGEGGGEHHDGEGQFDQGFHGFDFVFGFMWRFVLNRLHPLHRKRIPASYNYFPTTDDTDEHGRDGRERTRGTQRNLQW